MSRQDHTEVANPLCQWFAACDRPALGALPHPVLGHVPACERCAQVVGVELIPATFERES
jgi:hypothetical protein